MGSGLGLGLGLGLSRQACVRVRRRVRFRVRARERDLRAALVVSAADAAHEVARDQLGRAVAQRRVGLVRVRARLGLGLGLGSGLGPTLNLTWIVMFFVAQ